MQLIADNFVAKEQNSQCRRMRQTPTPLAQARPGSLQSELCRQPLWCKAPTCGNDLFTTSV